jgi:hypothetical protein
MSEEKIEKLKPCMFCETTEEVIEKEIDGPRGPQGISRRIAARKWNRRKQ